MFLYITKRQPDLKLKLPNWNMEPEQNPNGTQGNLNGTQTEPKQDLNGTPTEPEQSPNGTQTEPKQNLNGTQTEP